MMGLSRTGNKKTASLLPEDATAALSAMKSNEQDSLAEAVIVMPEERQPQSPKPQSHHRRSQLKHQVPWTDNIDCVAELTIERNASLVDVIEIHKALKNKLRLEVFYVDAGENGTTFGCGVPDAGALLDSLSSVPKLAAWSLIH
jgi:hypothetical protein